MPDFTFFHGHKVVQRWFICTIASTVCAINICSSETTFSVVTETQNWTDEQWSRMLFTDESRFSLTIDFGHIHIWREWETWNLLSNIIKRDLFGGGRILVWGSIMLGSHSDLHIFKGGSITSPCYCTEVLLSYVHLFRGVWVLNSSSWVATL